MSPPVNRTAYALACARRGWPVFPLYPGQKVAAVKDWEHAATTDPDHIRATWARKPYNIAIACGPARLVVLDLDPPHPGETPPPEWDLPGVNDGLDTLAVLAERHHQPVPLDTFQVRTRRGGMHLYFHTPPGMELRNTSSKHPATALGWCIDTRAAGGYVVAPGSYVDLEDGAGLYEVTHNPTPAPLPEWLCGLLSRPRTPRSSMECLPSAPGIGDLSAYVRQALQGESQRVAQAQHGGRSHALNKAAYNLGRLVSAGQLTADTVRAALHQAASVHFDHPTHPLTPQEASATITSGLTAGARHPRTLTTRSAA